jgi:CheY-like chemotaxis protein
MGPTNPHYKNISEILYAGQQSALLVKQLLAFSRRQALRPERFNVNDVVRGMEGMLRRLIDERIAIELTLAEGLPEVMADRNQIEQVVVNLAVNARDAMPGGGTLTIGTRHRDLDGSGEMCVEPIRSGSYVELTVRDTGTGIDAETLEHIFEPFFTTKGLDLGTGLGLSTVQGIAIQSGGHVAVETEAGKGSSFRVYLPITAVPAETVATPEAPILPGRGERILMVEDHPQIREILALMLQAYGYYVLEAAGPDDAIRLFSENSVDLLMTDISMPKMNGVELANRLRAARPGLKTLFVSGYSAETHERELNTASGCVFLQKGFSPDTLAATVRQLLDAPPVN